MASYEVIRALRDVLAKLYPTANMASLIVAQAGLNAQLVDFGGPPIQFWHAILTVANNNNQVQDIINAARSQLPGNEALLEAEQFFQSGTAPGSANTAPPAGTRPSGSSGGVNIGNVSGGIHNSIISGGDVDNASIGGVTPADGEE